jgi:2-oxoglutarate ferredoxin oxidoreductase subunit beta
VNTHGGHYIHGRSLPFSAAISLGRDDLHVFAFGGDGDGFSIGGNHLVHTARKNPRMTYVIMDNSVYGLTKKQTSPTSPLGFKSKTDPTGAIDQPINPMGTLVNSGASFIARSHATQINHMAQMMERAARHDGFSVVEILSECVEFFPGAFDAGNPRKGGAFSTIEERKNDGSPEDELRHDTSDVRAAYRLAAMPWPGVFGVFYESNRPTKNQLEGNLIAAAKQKVAGKSDLQILQSSFARLR